MEFRPGDILACYGTCPVARAIRRWTYRPWYRDQRLRCAPSHVGIIADLPVSGMTTRVLVESTSLCDRDCLITGRPVSGVQAHGPEGRVWDYLRGGGWVDQYRPTEACEFNDAELGRLAILCRAMAGHDYDTIGAGFSGLAITRRWLNRTADLSTLFCSELVARLLQCLNRMNWSNPSNWTPGDLIREAVCTGVYEHVRRYM